MDTHAVEGCGSGRSGYDKMFGHRFAGRIARRYDRHGLNPTQRRIVTFLADRGLEGADVLEIGGGIGDDRLTGGAGADRPTTLTAA